MSAWNAPRRQSGGWRRSRLRRASPSAPAFARYAVLALAAILIVITAWRGIRWTLRGNFSRQATVYPSDTSQSSASPKTLWQADFSRTLEVALRDVEAGNISAAEMGVDRADNLVTAARLESRVVKSDFITASLAQLDRLMAARSDDQRLLEHVTLARISLAELHSSQDAEPSSVPPDDRAAQRIAMAAPREIAANQTLDPASLGARYLDATLMPDTSEILLPPPSRAFADKIRVENLTIEGAAQTLDGIRWRNVTFIATRLRYEGGPLDLQNVKFVRCRFGFTADDRGARLAEAIALGKSSFSIE